MYLLQRLIGVGIYVVCAVAMYLLIPRIKGIKGTLNLYIIVLGIMGFCYVPMQGADLSRTYATMYLYANMSVSEIWNAMLKNSSPMVILYYHLIGRLGDDRLLPCITAIITFGFLFGIVKSCYRKYEIRKSTVAVSIFFFMSRGLLMATISNIRTMLAISLIAYSIYKILGEHQSIMKYIALLVIGSLLHTTGLAATLIFFAYYIFIGSKSRNRILSLCESILLLIGIVVFGKPYFLNAADKGLKYLSYAQMGTGYFYIWEMVLSLIVILFIILVFLKYYRRNCSKLEAEESTETIIYTNFMGFILLLSLLDFVALFIEFNIGLRLNYLLKSLTMPFFIFLLNSNDYSKQNKSKLYNCVLIVSAFLLFIACARGDLCSLKFR